MIAVGARTGGNYFHLSGSAWTAAFGILAACANRVARKIPIRREPSRLRLVGRGVDMRRQSWRNRIRARPKVFQHRCVILAPASMTRSTSSKAILAPRRRSRRESSTPLLFCSARISTGFCPTTTKRANSNNALVADLFLAYHPQSPRFPSRSPGGACHGLS